jgi:hypothetical protein
MLDGYELLGTKSEALGLVLGKIVDCTVKIIPECNILF